MLCCVENQGGSHLDREDHVKIKHLVENRVMAQSEVGDLYAMRRANGDWFALEDHGRMSVPLSHSSHDALMARLRNFGMLLFA